MFGVESIGDGDKISLYQATKILIKELNTSGMDFTDAINKFVINLLMPGSKSEISFKALLDEYEEYFSIEKGTSEQKYRDKCVKDMLYKISYEIIVKHIDLKEYGQIDFTTKEIEELIKYDLDVFKLKKKDKNKENRSKNDENSSKSYRKSESEKGSTTKGSELNSREEFVLKDTLDYIMDGHDIIPLSEFMEVMEPYMQKQKHSMEVLYKLKQHMKGRH